MKKNTEKGNIIGKMFNYYSDKDDNVDGYKDSGIEILSKRGKREKHFLQKDGTIIAKMYSDDIHYKKDGRYVEIDNRLMDYGDCYYNKNNFFKVKFMKKSNLDFLTYMFKNKKIIFNLVDNSNVPINIISNKNKLVNKVCYKNMYKGIDFEYIICPSAIKENIIIKNINSIKDEIQFFIKTDFELKLINSKKIEVLESNKTIFAFDIPFMCDSKGIKNYNVQYTLNSVKDGYELSLKLDKEWLLDNKRAYPVILDPTIYINENTSVADVTLHEEEPNTNLNSYYYLGASVSEGYVLSGYHKRRSLIRFELPYSRFWLISDMSFA